MSLQICSNQQYTLPSAAAGVTLPTTGAAWTNSAYVQIAASTAEVDILTGVVLWTDDPDAVGNGVDFEVDIATGAAASEVVIHTIRTRTVLGGLIVPEQIRLMIPRDNLNGRISARVRTSTTRSFNLFCSVTYLKNPITGTLQITTQNGKTYPAAANSKTATSSGTPWANPASWTEITAATAADIVLTTVIAELHSGGNVGEVDIGVGAAAAEVVVTTVRCEADSALGSNGNRHELPNPLDNIPSGSRIAFRPRCSAASKIFAVALEYHEKPL